MHINWNLDLGNILVFSGVLIGLYIALINRMKAMETKVDAIWSWFTGQVPDIGRHPQRRHVDRVFEAIKQRDDEIQERV